MDERAAYLMHNIARLKEKVLQQQALATVLSEYPRADRESSRKRTSCVVTVVGWFRLYRPVHRGNDVYGVVGVNKWLRKCWSGISHAHRLDCISVAISHKTDLYSTVPLLIS